MSPPISALKKPPCLAGESLFVSIPVAFAGEGHAFALKKDVSLRHGLLCCFRMDGCLAIGGGGCAGALGKAYDFLLAS